MVASGCIRKTCTLFPQSPIGTKVTVGATPLLYKVQDGQIDVQSFPPHEEHPEAKAAAKGQRFNKKVQDKMAQRAKLAAVTVDSALVEQVVNGSERRGRARVPADRRSLRVPASALLVENRRPGWRNLGRQRSTRADPR